MLIYDAANRRFHCDVCGGTIPESTIAATGSAACPLCTPWRTSARPPARPTVAPICEGATDPHPQPTLRTPEDEDTLLARYIMAVGLATTLVQHLVIDANDPIGMMRELVRVVTAERQARTVAARRNEPVRAARDVDVRRTPGEGAYATDILTRLGVDVPAEQRRMQEEYNAEAARRSAEATRHNADVMAARQRMQEEYEATAAQRSASAINAAMHEALNAAMAEDDRREEVRQTARDMAQAVQEAETIRARRAEMSARERLEDISGRRDAQQD